jgi:hypothetical protein
MGKVFPLRNGRSRAVELRFSERRPADVPERAGGFSDFQ